MRRGGTAAFLDIIGFKAFNDHYGVSLGDLVIRRLGEILSEEVRPDFTGHVGGDDFVCAGENGGFRGRVESARLRFRALAPGFYHDRDREAGGIEAFDRYGGYRFFPFLDLTVVFIRAADRREAVEALCLRAGREKSRIRGAPVAGELAPLFSAPAFGNLPDRDRKALLEAAGILREKSAVKGIADLLLGRSGWNVRKSAALALGRIGGGEAVSALLLAVRDESPHVRTRAVEGLVLASGRSAGPLIAPLAEDSSTWVRRAVLRGIGGAGWSPGLPVLKRAALVVRPNLVNTLAERAAALEGMALLGDAASSPFLAGLCGDSRYEPSREAYRALCAGGGDPAAMEVLRRGAVPENIRLEGVSPGNLRALETLAASNLSRNGLRMLEAFPVELSAGTAAVLRRWLGEARDEEFLQLVQVLEARGISGDASCAARVAARLDRGDPALDPRGIGRFLIWLSRSPGVRPGVFLKPFLRMPSGQVRLAAATALSMGRTGLDGGTP
jgi:HEAT repeat protein